MKQLISIIVAFFIMISTPAFAEKPSWAGKGGKPSRDEVESHVDQMKNKHKDKKHKKDKKDKHDDDDDDDRRDKDRDRDRHDDDDDDRHEKDRDRDRHGEDDDHEKDRERHGDSSTDQKKSVDIKDVKQQSGGQDGSKFKQILEQAKQQQQGKQPVQEEKKKPFWKFWD